MPIQILQKKTCNFWHPPVCQKYKSEKDVCMATNVISDMLRQKESPTKGQRKVVQKDQLCVSRFFSEKILFM